MDPRILAAEGGGSNFLIPNGTFLFELLLFLLILFILSRYVIPPIQQAMRERAELIAQGAQDAQRARERAEEAQRAQRAELDAARAEGGRIREKARGEAGRVAEEKRHSAQQDVTALHDSAEAQLRVHRERAAHDLHGQVGSLAMTLAARILGSDPSEDPEIRATVEGYLSGLEPPTATEAALPVERSMQAAAD